MGTINKKFNKEKVNITVYADDFVVTESKGESLEEIKIMIEDFLKERGLELSNEKTIITHIEDGFDFLGWHFRKYENKLLIAPSQKSQKNTTMKIKEIRQNLMQKQEIMIIRLNKLIRGCAIITDMSAQRKHFKHWIKTSLNICGYGQNEGIQ